LGIVIVRTVGWILEPEDQKEEEVVGDVDVDPNPGVADDNVEVNPTA
jgi:hypothetical protein